MRTITLIATLLLAAPAMASTVALPADLSGYFHRLARCQDEGKVSSHMRDDSASSHICNELPSDKKAMLEKYSNVPEYVELLNAY